MFENVPAVSAMERELVIGALERLQTKLSQREEWTHSETMATLSGTLQSPLFTHILTLQQSIKQLKTQLSSLPPDSSPDFSFSPNGELIINAVDPGSGLVPPTKPVSTNQAPPLAVSSNKASSPSGSQQTPPPTDPLLLQRWVHSAAKGRWVERVSLSRPLSGGLGFSVVGLNPEGSSAQGVLIKHIQPGGIAHRDGRLQERDQILVINGSPLEPGISQQEALGLLQQPGQTVDLVVARERPLNASSTTSSPSITSQAKVMSTDEWGHVEQMQLVNDGSGLGFGIVGGNTAGVVVRTIVKDSVADKDGRLRTGDHILSIGATPTNHLTSDQVVKVLQGCGSNVTMVIARDPKGQRSTAPPPPPPPSAPVTAPRVTESTAVSSLAPRLTERPPLPPQRRHSKTPNLEGYEIHEVPLTKKDGQSLGISIVGYNPLTSQDAVGVFVKHVVPGSAADQNGNIRVHDRLIALDGVSLHGRTNQEVLDVMRHTGQTVTLSLVRKRERGMERSLDKVERESFRVSSLRRSLEVNSRSSGFEPTTNAEQLMKDAELRAKWELALGPDYQVLVVKLDPIIEDDAGLQKSSKLLPVHTVRLGVELDSFDGHHYISSVVSGGPIDTHGELRPEDELLEVNEVQLYGKSRREVVSFLKEVPPPFTLVCCRHTATFDPETSDPMTFDPETQSEPATSDPKYIQETDPGSVTQYLNKQGYYQEKPQGFKPHSEPQYRPESDLESEAEIQLQPTGQRQPSVEEIELKLSSMLCRQTEVRESFTEQQEEREAVTCDLNQEVDSSSGEEDELALWSADIQTVELEKHTDRGLGFSILDYQDPLDPGRCVMVIRSLVPGGCAELHGGLLPGDQLASVNQTWVEGLSLTQAVDLLKAVQPGRVALGIRKPMVETPERRRQESSTQLPVPKGFGDSSIFPQNLQPELESESEEEPELILDGGLPRYSSLPRTYDIVRGTSDITKGTSDITAVNYDLILSGVDSREMAVDEEMEGELSPSVVHTEADTLVVERVGESSTDTLPRKQPPSWDEWKTDSLGRTRAVEDVLERTLRRQHHVESDQESIGSVGKIILGIPDSRDSEADSELTLTDTDTESVRMIDTGRRKRRSQGGASLPIRGGQSDLPEREDGEGEETPVFSHWGPPRRVEVWPEDGQSLGISIVGGRNVIKRLRNGEELKGIFIKQVLTNSPAERTGFLKTGDKILEVSGVDLRLSSHDEAVAAIKSAASPVVFIVQSLSSTPRPVSLTATSFIKHRAKRTQAPQPGLVPPPPRQPPPYRPVIQSEEELQQAKGLL